MSKSVLVIDTPESCAQCPLLNGSDECVMQDASANFNADSFDDLMHGCPLKSLPEKMTGVAPTDHWNSIKAGMMEKEVKTDVFGKYRKYSY